MTKAEEIAKRTIEIEANAILQLSNRIGAEFTDVVNLLLVNPGKVVVTGMGKSGIVGNKIAATLASTGTPSFFMHPGDAFHGDLGMVENRDVILAISNSGETDEVLRLIPFFNDNGNTIIAMTGNKHSTLAQNAKFHLDISVEKEACPLELAPTSSTTSTLVMGDALAITVMELRGFRAENFARFHPGGSLGRRLLTQVKHVMKSENLPIVDEASPMLDVIHSISQGRLGLAVVLEGGLIHGIITDGDMRRVFENYGESAFRLTAGKIMTKEPKCISHDTKLQDVQDIMIGKKINSLLVTENGRPNQLLGVIQVYDIK